MVGASNQIHLLRKKMGARTGVRAPIFVVNFNCLCSGRAVCVGANVAGGAGAGTAGGGVARVAVCAWLGDGFGVV